MRPTAREFELMRSFGPAARLRSQNKFAATINYRPVRGAGGFSVRKGEGGNFRTDMLRYPAHLLKKDGQEKRNIYIKYLLRPHAGQNCLCGNIMTAALSATVGRTTTRIYII